MKQLVLVGRLIFGAWMLANGANDYLSLWPMPVGHEPLAIQLMDAFVHSRLLDVAMLIQLLAGALLLTGLFVPVALCVVMPISTCALYWAAVLDHRPLGTALATAAFALNGFLMLAYIDYYRGALQRQAVACSESSQGHSTFDVIFANPAGRTSRRQFTAALITLLAVVVFYERLVGGLTAHWCLLMLVFPATVVSARRLHDMGYSAWPVLLLALPTLAAFSIWLGLVNFGARLSAAVTWVTFVVAAAFVLWGCLGRGKAAANRYGTPLQA